MPAGSPPRVRWPVRSSTPGAQRTARGAARTSAAGPTGAAIGAMRPTQRRRLPGGPATLLGLPATACQAAGTRSSHGHDLADLYRPEAGVRAPGCDRRGRAGIRCVNDEVPGDHLLALGEGTVQHTLLPVADADLLCLCDRAQRCAALEHALADQAHRILAHLLHRALAIVVSGDEVGILGQDEHVFHRPLLRR